MYVEFEIKTVDTELIVVCKVELGGDGFEKVTDVVAWTVYDNEEYDLDDEELKAVEQAAGVEYWKRRSFCGKHDS